MIVGLLLVVFSFGAGVGFGFVLGLLSDHLQIGG